MIYIAAPLFSEMERDYICKIAKLLCLENNLSRTDLYIPHLDNKEYSEMDKYTKNIKYLNECDLMVAILDGKDTDSGTAFEIGYFEAQYKIVLGLLTDKRSYDVGEFNSKSNTMILGSCCDGDLIFDDIDDLIDELMKIMNYFRGINE